MTERAPYGNQLIFVLRSSEISLFNHISCPTFFRKKMKCYFYWPDKEKMTFSKELCGKKKYNCKIALGFNIPEGFENSW